MASATRPRRSCWPKGLTISEIQKGLGHRQITLTANLCTHAAPDVVQRAAETMDTLFGTG